MSRTLAMLGIGLAPWILCVGMARSVQAFDITPIPPSILIPTPIPPDTSAPGGVTPPSPPVLAPPAFTIGSNFEGISAATSGFRPPDTDGAIGPTSFVELINGSYAVFNRTGGAPIQSSTLDQFWVNSGLTLTGNFTFDPRVLYDKFSGRWFAAAADNTGFPNNILVAVSKSSDPTAGWTGFKINSSPTADHWLDFPTLGVNANGVFITGNMVNSATNVIDKSNVLVLPKADLIAGSIANRTLVNNIDPNTTGFTIQPLVSLDNSGQPHPLLSDFNTPAGFIKRSDITGVISSPTLDTSKALISVPPFNNPPKAPQPGSTAQLDTNDSRFSSSVVLVNGKIWGVQTVDNGGRSALRWLRIDAASNTLEDKGLISDASLFFFFGSIAVNANGDIAIGFSASSSTQFAGSYAVPGKFDGTNTTFGTPVLLRAGQAAYGATGQVNRWGDYSAMTVDPNDPSHFWTVQEWAGPNGGTDWRTQITELIFAPLVPEPSTVTLTAIGAVCLLGYGWRRRRAA